WKPSTLENVANERACQIVGKSSILESYPLITESVKTTLAAIRELKAPVSVSIAQALIRAEVEDGAPELLERGFKISEKYVRNFLASQMQWSPRSGTRPAHHLPDDAEEQLCCTFFRLRFAIKAEKIPARVSESLSNPSQRTE
ncbi:hypothetical protein C8F01DRAFT_984012, partial [Mycena amicta]